MVMTSDLLERALAVVDAARKTRAECQDTAALITALCELDRALAAFDQERPPEAPHAPQAAEQPPKAPADTPDPADDHTALGEYPPLTTGCDFAGGKHLLNSDNVCVRCETAVPELPRRLLDSLNRTNGPRPETPRSPGPYDDPPSDIRDAPASYTTEGPGA